MDGYVLGTEVSQWNMHLNTTLHRQPPVTNSSSSGNRHNYNWMACQDRTVQNYFRLLQLYILDINSKTQKYAAVVWVDEALSTDIFQLYSSLLVLLINLTTGSSSNTSISYICTILPNIHSILSQEK